ncbi:hypothetical protein GPU70_05030 [Streptococcus thermophilus]|nr:hypothetical protein [Streptococcus thermophilus]
MTAFGFVWIIILFLTLVKNNLQLLVTLVIISTTLQSSNVFVVGGQGVGPQIITSIVFIFYILFSRGQSLKFNISKSIITSERTLILFIIYIVFNSIHSGTLVENFLRILQILTYALCFLAMESAGKVLDDEFVFKTIRKVSYFVLIVGIVQVMATTNLIPRYGFIRDLFWNDSVNNPEVVQFMWPHGSYFRFFSTYMEPSYFVGFSIGAIFYFFNYKERLNETRLLVLGLLLATILSFSSTGYGALFITAVMYIAFSKEGNNKIFLLVGSVITFFIFYFSFYNILDSVIFSKMESGSAAARRTWNLVALQTFNTSPIAGIGYKNCRASSLLYTILAELGIIGLIIYFIFILSIIYPIFSKKMQSIIGSEQVGIIFALFGVIVSQMIAVPDFDISTFWMWMNFLGLIKGRNEVKSLNGEKG